MQKNLFHKYRIPTFIFAISLLTYIIFIITEDILMSKSPINSIGKIYAGKIFLAISLSSISSLMSFVLIYSIQKSLKTLNLLITEWGQNLSDGDFQELEEESEEIEDEEISEIARSFKIAVFQNKEREDSMVKDLLSLNTEKVSNNLQSELFTFPLKPIKRLDISVLPITSKNANCDFVSVIETANGCLGIMAGFQTNDIQEASMKFRLHGILSLAEKATSIPSDEILSYIDSAIRKIKISNLNITIFTLDSMSGELKTIQYQKNPIFLLQSDSVKTVQANGEFFNFERQVSQVKTSKISKGDSMIFVSDRILTPLNTNSATILNEIQKKIKSESLQLKSSRDIILSIARNLDTIGKSLGIRSILEILSIIVVKKKS